MTINEGKKWHYVSGTKTMGERYGTTTYRSYRQEDNIEHDNKPSIQAWATSLDYKHTNNL